MSDKQSKSNNLYWTKLTPWPAKANCSAPIAFNDKELILAPYTSDSDSLYKYNFITDEWIKWFAYPESLRSKFHTASINKDKTILYIYNELGNIIEIDLIKHIFTISPNKYHDGSHIASLVIDEQFHIMGGWESKDRSHWIWDKENKALKHIFKFEGIESLKYHANIYIPSQKSVLIVDGSHDSVYLYNLKTKTLTTWPIILNAYAAGSVAVNKEELVLVFGGHKETDDVHIIDINTRTMRKSKIKCPVKGRFKATVRDDTDRANLMVYGYIHQCWSLDEFNNIQYLSSDLINLIQSFFSAEIVHIFDIDNPGHWRAFVHDIID